MTIFFFFFWILSASAFYATHHHHRAIAAMPRRRHKAVAADELLASYLLSEEALRAAVLDDDEAVKAFQTYRVAALPSSNTTYARTKTDTKGKTVVLLHGFDSSALEFRRLLPELEKRNVRAFALDVLGSGFSQADDVSVAAKRRQIKEFLDFCRDDGQRILLVGSSLGGATAVDYAYHHRDVELALLAPQVTIDGAPTLPDLLAGLGVKLLKSYPLRWVANQMAYADTGAFATQKAIAVGRLHTRRADWEALQQAWLQTGGYTQISSHFKDVAADSSRMSIFWGKQDNILPIFPDTFDVLRAVAPNASITLYDDCGHVPHLEKPLELASALADLVDAEDATT